jgi:hypothetical protein
MYLSIAFCLIYFELHLVEELEKKFPKLLLVPEEASKAAEALSKDAALQDMLQNGLAVHLMSVLFPRSAFISTVPHSL